MILDETRMYKIFIFLSHPRMYGRGNLRVLEGVKVDNELHFFAEVDPRGMWMVVQAMIAGIKWLRR